MSFLDWIVVLATVGTVVFAWALFVLQSYRMKNEKTDLDEEEERLLELMGKVRIFVDSKLELLDRKLEEIRGVIRELNEKYIEFSSLLVSDRLTGSEKSKPEFSKTDESRASTELTEPQRSNRGYPRPAERSEKSVVPPEPELLGENQVKHEKPAGAELGLQPESIEDKVSKMYDDGLEPLEIARRLNIGLGEVTLILDLYRRQGRISRE